MKLNKHLIKYEIRNYLNNLMGLCYLIVLPLGLALLFALINGSDPSTNTYLLLIFSALVPMAATFNHAGNYANELESGAVQRLKLFGYSERTLLFAKLIVNLLFITLSFVIYFVVLFLAIPIQLPTVAAFTVLIVFLYILSAILFVFMHAIATLCGSFSLTYGLTLILLCIFMLFGGMMGVDLGIIGNIFPIYHLGKGFLIFWCGGNMNFLPLILSTLGFAAVSTVLMVLSVWISKRRIKGNQKKKNLIKTLFKLILPFRFR